MSGEGVFTQQTRGVGADTGECELEIAANASGIAQKAVCMWEEPGGDGKPSGRRRGPLLLSVATDLSMMDPKMTEGPVQGVALPSKIRGYGVWEQDQFPGWGVDAFGFDTVGSLLLELTVGAVTRTLTADLAPGTYQLPPCDAVKVSAGIRRYSGSVARKMRVACSVTPGAITHAAIPLIYTDCANFDATQADDDLAHDFFSPEGATRFAPFNYGFPRGVWAPSDFKARARVGGQQDYSGDPMSQAWFIMPPPFTQVTVDYSWDGLGEADTASSWVGVRWRIDP